jgi:hypothetical protein
MVHLKHLWETCALYAHIRWYNFCDFWRTLFRYWRRAPFAIVDLTLLLSYFYRSPYRISRTFEEARTSDPAPYGETPLALLDTVLQAAGVTKDDGVYELGSGRGRAAFWIALCYGCHTVGIEYHPLFMQVAERIRRFFRVTNLEFRCEDMCTSDYSKATVIYLFGTALRESEIRTLCRRFAVLPHGTTIITVSYPLRAYHPAFTLVRSIEVDFVWGKTTVYIQKVS